MRLLTLDGMPDRIDGKCAGFAWVGQHFRSCDVCGEPYWEHEYERRYIDGKDGRMAITPELAAAVKAKWSAIP